MTITPIQPGSDSWRRFEVRNGVSFEVEIRLDQKLNDAGRRHPWIVTISKHEGSEFGAFGPDPRVAFDGAAHMWRGRLGVDWKLVEDELDRLGAFAPTP